MHLKDEAKAIFNRPTLQTLRQIVKDKMGEKSTKLYFGHIADLPGVFFSLKMFSFQPDMNNLSL